MSVVTSLSAAVKRFQTAMISRFAQITRIRMRQIGIRVSIYVNLKDYINISQCDTL